MIVGVVRVTNYLEIDILEFMTRFKELLIDRDLEGTMTACEVVIYFDGDDFAAHQLQLNQITSRMVALSPEPVPVFEVGLAESDRSQATALLRARRATRRLSGRGFLWSEEMDYFVTNKIRGPVSIGVLISQNCGEVFRGTLTHAYDRAQRSIREYVAHSNIPCDFYSDGTIAFVFTGADADAHAAKLLEMRARIGTYTAINSIFGHGIAHATKAEETTHVILISEAVKRLGVKYNAKRR